VLGIGAVALPVPPVEVVYHNKFVPVAVNAVAVAPWHYTTGETVGAEGVAFTVRVAGVPVAAKGEQFVT
jgi:hypothetical protein